MTIRWIATITYRFDVCFRVFRNELEELADLHDVVEQGPHWDTIDQIVVERAGKEDPTLTVERAARL